MPSKEKTAADKLVAKKSLRDRLERMRQFKKRLEYLTETGVVNPKNRVRLAGDDYNLLDRFPGYTDTWNNN